VCLPGNSILSRTGYILGNTRLGFGASHRLIGDLKMKKLVLALTAIAAFSGAALAADLPARTYTKAPAPLPVAPSWTGFYLFGGGGYGIWDADNQALTVPGGIGRSTVQRMGGDGYFGTVGGGYDWQFNQSWVAGIFADAQFGSLKGTVQDAFNNVSGSIKDRTNWAAGVRVGYLVAPSVLSYVNGGYSGGEFSGSTLSGNLSSVPFATTQSFNRNGWFVGGGVENSLNFFGIAAPGWFMKTEYRVAEYDKKTLIETTLGGIPTGSGVTFNPIVQTVSTSLVYRFNWGGPIVAKY
jgi:outer membrane immunogenic protein